MDFHLTDEQDLLRDTTRDLLSRSYDTESRNKVDRAPISAGAARCGASWPTSASSGSASTPRSPARSRSWWCSPRSGAGWRPNRSLHAALAPGALIAELGTDAQRAAARRGRRRPTAAGVRASRARRARGSTTRRDHKAEQQGDSWTLSGRKNPVLAGDSADTLVVSAALPDGGIGVFLVDAAATVTRHRYRTFDGQRGAQVDLDVGTRRTARARRSTRSTRHPRRHHPHPVGTVRRSGRRDGGGAAADHRIPEDAASSSA